MINFLQKLFNKNNDTDVVKFYPLYDLAPVDSPIIRSSKFKRDWVEEQKKVFQQHLDTASDSWEYKITSSHRCPALVDMFLRGFIVSAYRDFYLHTRGDIENPEVASYTGITVQEQILRRKRELSNTQILDPEEFRGASLLGIKRPYPERTPNVIFKLETPWLISCPKDIVLYISGIPLSNNDDFTIIPGILDPRMDSFLQVLLWWHHHDRNDIFIKKGTPLIQIMPVSKKDICKTFKMVSDPDLIKKKIKSELQVKHVRNWTQFLPNYNRLRENVVLYEDLMETKRDKGVKGGKCPFSSIWAKG
jgi:hypothetical protein